MHLNKYHHTHARLFLLFFLLLLSAASAAAASAAAASAAAAFAAAAFAAAAVNIAYSQHLFILCFSSVDMPSRLVLLRNRTIIKTNLRGPPGGPRGPPGRSRGSGMVCDAEPVSIFDRLS